MVFPYFKQHKQMNLEHQPFHTGNDCLWPLIYFLVASKGLQHSTTAYLMYQFKQGYMSHPTVCHFRFERQCTCTSKSQLIMEMGAYSCSQQVVPWFTHDSTSDQYLIVINMAIAKSVGNILDIIFHIQR